MSTLLCTLPPSVRIKQNNIKKKFLPALILGEDWKAGGNNTLVSTEARKWRKKLAECKETNILWIRSCSQKNCQRQLADAAAYAEEGRCSGRRADVPRVCTHQMEALICMK